MVNALSITLPVLDKLQIFNSKELKFYLDKLDSFIKYIEAQAVGPLIMKTSLLRVDNNTQFVAEYIQQIDKLIYNTSTPYNYYELMDIPECIYTNYHGQASKLMYSYCETKNLIKEEGKAIVGEIYTVFIANDSQQDTISIDLYIPTKD